MLLPPLLLLVARYQPVPLGTRVVINLASHPLDLRLGIAVLASGLRMLLMMKT
jgi:hypothetical protein